MKDLQYYMGILSNINRMYIDVLNSSIIDINLLEQFNEELMNVCLNEYSSDDQDILSSVITSALEQYNLIKYLLNKREMNTVNIDVLRKEFVFIETEHFNILNSYVQGTLVKDSIDCYYDSWKKFRERLYQYEPNEDEIMEVAKMKSKVQHFSTDIFEDEDVLSIAYSNVN